MQRNFPLVPHLDSGGELFPLAPHLDSGGELSTLVPHLDSGGEQFPLGPHLNSGGAEPCVGPGGELYADGAARSHTGGAGHRAQAAVAAHDLRATCKTYCIK